MGVVGTSLGVGGGGGLRGGEGSKWVCGVGWGGGGGRL